MNRFIIEKSEEVRAPDGSRTWPVVQRGSGDKVGTLRRSGMMFKAESDTLRTSAEAKDHILVLKVTFRSEHLFIRDGDNIREISPDDLQD